MRKIYLALIVIGVLSVVFSLLGDFLDLGQRGEIGAAQILGIDVGIGLLLLGVGLLTLEQHEETNLRRLLQGILKQIPDISPTVWAVLSFIVVYCLLFIFPMFFTRLSIQYFTKYIPDAGSTQSLLGSKG